MCDVTWHRRAYVHVHGTSRFCCAAVLTLPSVGFVSSLVFFAMIFTHDSNFSTGHVRPVPPPPPFDPHPLKTRKERPNVLVVTMHSSKKRCYFAWEGVDACSLKGQCLYTLRRATNQYDPTHPPTHLPPFLTDVQSADDAALGRRRSLTVGDEKEDAPPGRPPWRGASPFNGATLSVLTKTPWPGAQAK